MYDIITSICAGALILIRILRIYHAVCVSRRIIYIYRYRRRTVVGLGNRLDCSSYIEWSRSAATDAFRMRQIIIIRKKYILYDLYLYIGEEKGLRARLSTLLYHVYILYMGLAAVWCVRFRARPNPGPIYYFILCIISHRPRRTTQIADDIIFYTNRSASALSRSAGRNGVFASRLLYRGCCDGIYTYYLRFGFFFNSYDKHDYTRSIKSLWTLAKIIASTYLKTKTLHCETLAELPFHWYMIH